MILLFSSKKALKIILSIVLSLLIAVLSIYLTSTIINIYRGIRLPIIMYHSVLKDESLSGDYAVTPLEVESDFKYLKDNGYTPILCEDLVSYVYSDTELPDKPVILSFDDGCYNNISYVIPLLEKYNFKAVFSVVGSFTDKASAQNSISPNSSYMTWSDITKAYNSGHIEIACHSDNLHTLGERKGACIKQGESYESYRSVFINDTLNFISKIKQNSRIVPITYSYPFGFASKESEALIKACGFKVSFLASEKQNYIKKDKESLFGLNRFNRQSGISTDDFMKKALN